MGYEDFIATLDPKIAKAVKTAEETKIDKLALSSYGLTKALNGGIAKGRMATIYGPPSSGKSLLMQESIGIWQREFGQVCAWVDSEGSWDKRFADRLGVDNKELILIHSKSSGRIEKEVRPLIENNVDILVIDSISDILPEAFVGKDGSMNEQEDRKQMGAHAKAITALINGMHYVNNNTAIVLLSQQTTFIGQTYVELVPHGGQKVQFASSQIVKLNSSASEGAQLKGKKRYGDRLIDAPVARKVEYLVKKNKLGSPFTKGEYIMHYAGEQLGIDKVGEVLKDAVKYEIATQSGAWFYLDDNKFQGEANLVKHLHDNPERLEMIKKEIYTIETGEVVE